MDRGLQNRLKAALKPRVVESDMTAIDKDGMTMEMIAAVKESSSAKAYNDAIQPRNVAIVKAKPKATVLVESQGIAITPILL